MRIAILAISLCLGAASSSPLAAGVAGKGTWESTLQPRDLDGDGRPDAFYDTVLNITWLRDADRQGLMFLPQARAWAENLDVAGYRDWRLPKMVDTGRPGCDWAYGGTDCGYNVQTVAGTRVLSEMAHLFGVTLGNTPYCADNGVCDAPGWGLTNRGDFLNLRDYFYWFGNEYVSTGLLGWYYYTPTIYQSVGVRELAMHAIAVRDGDTPEPARRPVARPAPTRSPNEPSRLVPAVAAEADWRVVLLPRDLDGDGQADAFYDTRLNITWLRQVNPAGPMFWPDAQSWVSQFTIGGLGGWRLPRSQDLRAPGCDFSYVGSDCGYNVLTTKGTEVYSELAHLFAKTLGNTSYCNTRGSCGQPGWGLTKTGDFVGMDANFYWTSVAYGPAPDFQAWYFYPYTLYQSYAYQIHLLNVLPVHDGDVGTPVPAR